mmetsp:Transcript_8508/g.17491  ORF Transcript_8508/g.17491 Transcript_8508/m.17491 type:complete len:80 (-) Transcript_8508:840-1079(-)
MNFDTPTDRPPDMSAILAPAPVEKYIYYSTQKPARTFNAPTHVEDDINYYSLINSRTFKFKRFRKRHVLLKAMRARSRQ